MLLNMEDFDSSYSVENTDKSATVQCIQYLLLQHMKSKNLIKKDDLMKTFFKGRISGKNYDRVMNDVENTLNNVFGFSISNIKHDCKQFIIINHIEIIDIADINSTSSRFSEKLKYRVLLKPIIGALIMLRLPISEGQMWNIMEQFTNKLNLNMHIIKEVVKGDFVKDHYLQYKATDETTVMFDPEKTSYWFSLGPRALVECDSIMLLQRVSELYNIPAKSFKRVYAEVAGK